MLHTSEIENILKQVYNKYSNIKLGIAGSYVMKWLLIYIAAMLLVIRKNTNKQIPKITI